MSTSVTENGVTREVGMYTCVDGVMRLMSLDTSDATATAADIGAGVTAYGASGKITGTGKVLDYLIVGASKTVLYDGLEVPTPSRANIVRGGGVGAISSAAFVKDSELHFRNNGNMYYRDLNISDTRVRVAPIYLDRELSFYYVIGKDKTL